MNFKIIRVVADKPKRVILTGLSREEARVHCALESTHEIDEKGNVLWYDTAVHENKGFYL